MTNEVVGSSLMPPYAQATDNQLQWDGGGNHNTQLVQGDTLVDPADRQQVTKLYISRNNDLMELIKQQTKQTTV